MSRIVNFFDAAQSETVPTIGSLVASKLIVYTSDAEYEGQEPTTVDGSIYYNSTLDLPRVYIDGAWKSLATEDDIAELNQRIDELTLNDLADVNTTGVLDGQPLVYDTLTQTWVPGPAAPEGVILKDGSVAMEADLNIGENAVRRVTMITDVDDVNSIDPGNRQLISGGLPTFSWGNPGELDAHTRKVVNVVDPVNLQDAATKKYVDDQIAAIDTSGAVDSVNGQTGAVVLALDDINDVNAPTPEDGQALIYDAGSNTWVPGDAAGTGTGGKNYFDAESSDFEKGTTGTWGISAIGLTLTATNTIGQVLAGERSLSYAKDAADRNGVYASLLTRTLDRADQGKPLFGSFSYDASAANYNSADVTIEAYDYTDPMSPVLLYAGPLEARQLLKGQGKFDYVVYTEQATEVVELRLVISSTNATAYTVYFDEFRLGPAASVNAVYRNEAVINLAGSGNFTGGSIRVSRVGGLVSISTVTALSYASATSASSAVGAIPTWARPSSPTSPTNVYDRGATNILTVNIQSNGTLTVDTRNYSGTLATNVGTGDRLAISYPVEDTSSQVLTTNELGLQTGAFRASRNGTNQTGVNPNNSAVKVLINSTASANDYVRGLTYDAANSRFVNSGPSGVFTLSAQITVLFTNVLNDTYRLIIRRGLSDVIVQQQRPAAGSAFIINASGDIFLNNGDFVEVFLFGLGNNSVNTLTVSGDSTFTWFSGKRNADFTVLGAVRERNKVQTKILSASVTTNITASDLTFNNLVIGKWYAVSGQLRLIVNSGVNDSIVTVSIVHNGANIGQKTLEATDGTSTQDANNFGVSLLFRAAATTLTFVVSSASSNSFLAGNGTRSLSYIQLEERNDLMETTDFT